MSEATQKRRAVLVDQHPLWLDGVENVVVKAGVHVLAKLNSASVARDRIEALRPDLLITGIEMADGGIDGLELVRYAKSRVSNLRAIMLSSLEDPQHIDAAFAAGAESYVLKTAHHDDLTSAIRQAFRHSVWFASGRAPAPSSAPALGEEPGLTRREREILRLVAEGHSNGQLARMLWVTEQTVKFHLSNIYRKLDVSNRTEASRWAQLHGMLPAAGDGSPVLNAPRLHATA